MAAYRRVYDSRHLQADCQYRYQNRNPTLSIFEYGLHLPPLWLLACFVDEGHLPIFTLFWETASIRAYILSYGK